MQTQTATLENETAVATILVVEDDHNLLEGIRNILEIEHYSVFTAQDGVEALAILRQEAQPPDLIVSDIMMPHMSGIELLEAVRQVPEWLSIPFIFLTAKGEKADIQRGKRLGVDDYVTKPYDPVDLLIAIESRLNRHQGINAVHSSVMNEMKREILTILNHEFRTPLTFVVAYSDMLSLPDMEQMQFDEMMSYLKGISTGADRLRDLIEDFIILVELQTGEAQKTYDWRKKEIVNFGAVMKAVHAEVFQSDEVDHTCDLVIARDIPPFVGDEDYLRRAMRHLLCNAIKFSDPQMPIEFSAKVEHGQLLMDVKDYGRGIPANELNKIWRSFYQVNRAFYEDQGAGSGLAIVQKVAELHGGQATVTSKEHVGSIFTIRLPLP